MELRTVKRLLVLAMIVGLSSAGFAQGPDVIVGAVTDVNSYGSQGSIAAFSLGATSCNVGTQVLQWFALPNTNHPVIAQDLYRVMNGRLEHVGMSWLKHGFATLNGTLCGSCQPTGGSTLGVGCSDPYGAGLNGSQGGLGPRSDVNASNGIFPVPSPPGFSGNIDRRLQVHHNDLDAGLNPNSTYFGAVQYVTPDDAQAGNGNNNASWRLATISPNGASFTMGLTGATTREECAVEAWKSIDSAVQTQFLDIPGDGRVWVGYKGTPASGGTRHTIAVMNLTSHESIRAVEIGQTASATVSNLYFHDVEYHSGEPFSGTDWNGTVASNGVSWSTDAFGQNANANAIRWGTTYTFEFVSDEPIGDIILTTFRSNQQYTLAPFGTTPPPPFQVNQARASLDINGLTNDGSTPIEANLGLNELAFLNYAGTTGAPYDIGIMTPDPVASAFVTPGNQVLNLDLLQTTFLFGGGFANAMPGIPVQIAFTTPNVNFDLSAQMGVLDGGSPDGFGLSAPVDLRVAACTGFSETLGLGDDDFSQISLGAGTNHECVSSLSFGGTSWNSIYVNSNGSASFGFGSSDFSATAAEFRSQGPRLAGAWSDLSPNAGGTVSIASNTSGLLTVSFAGVPEFSGGGSMTFDLVFNSTTGECSISNYQNSSMTTDTLVGLNPIAGGTGNSVNWGSLVGLGNQPGSANVAVYQFTGGSAPTGFSSITFSNGTGANYMAQ